MNLAYLGDALDHWKGSLFELLKRERLLRDFAVDPMATDAGQWTADDYSLFARLLRITDAQILRHRRPLAKRFEYFAELDHPGDLFLDPDTGIDTGGRSPVEKYVTPQEIRDLLQGRHSRVVAVYQHVRAQRTSARVDSCLRSLAEAVGGTGIGWCSYESGTVAMLFLSRDPARTTSIAAAFGRLLGRHAEGRVRTGTDRPAAHQDAGADGIQSLLRPARGDNAATRGPKNTHEYACPIPDCQKVFKGTRGGWDAHVGSPGRHPDWYPDVRDPEKRRELCRSDFPEFFR